MKREYITIAVPSADIAEIKTTMDQWPITDTYEQVIDLGNPIWTKSGQDYHVISLDAERVNRKVAKDFAKWLKKESDKMLKADMMEIATNPTEKLEEKGYVAPVVEDVEKKGKI